MKIRTDFVTNSSSSSFICVKKMESAKLLEVFEQAEISIDEFIEFFNTSEEDVELSSNPAAAICNLCILKIKMSLFDFSSLDGDDIIEYINDELWNTDVFDSLQCVDELMDMIDELDEDEDDAEIVEEIKRYCRLIKLIAADKDLINCEITADITSARIQTDSGCPDFGYDHLNTEKGFGKYVSLTSYELEDEDSEAMEWAKEHGYYNEDDEEFDTDFICDPPFEEMSKSYPAVYDIEVNPPKLN